MNFRLLPLLWLLALPLNAQDLSNLDRQAGWNGIRLEMPGDSIVGLMRAGNMPGTQRRVGRWLRPTDTDWAAPQGIERVEYGLFQSQLHSLVLHTVDAASSQGLLLQLHAAFGPGNQKGRAPSYVWQSQYVRLEFDQNLLTGKAVVTFLSIPLQRAMEATWAD